MLWQIPIGGEDNFQGMVDLVRMKGITWDGEVNPTSLFLDFETGFPANRSCQVSTRVLNPSSVSQHAQM